MKKIKLFPAPHVEIRISVSDEMKRDMEECRRMSEADNWKDCDTCSWYGIDIGHTGLCELPEVQRQVLEEKEDEVQGL